VHQSCLWQPPVTDEESAWFAVLVMPSVTVFVSKPISASSLTKRRDQTVRTGGSRRDLDEAVVPTEQERVLRIVGR